MSTPSRLSRYKQHVEKYGEDQIMESAENDRRMTEEDREALRVWLRKWRAAQKKARLAALKEKGKKFSK